MSRPASSTVSRWRAFRAFWDIGFLWHDSYYAVATRGFYFRTPLIAMSFEHMVPDFMTQSFFTGLRLYLLPQSWTLKIQEGTSMYRHVWNWGRMVPREFLTDLRNK